MTQQSSSKTGGNKKSSSPSDVRYWQRAKTSNFAETHKARRLARHLKRMGLDPKYRGGYTPPGSPAHGR